MGRPDVAQTETDGLEVLETREWVDSLDYVFPAAARTAQAVFCSNWRCTRGARRESICRSRRPRLIRTRFPRGSRPRFLAARRWSAASRAWSAGTRWPWWFAPTKFRKALAGTFRLSPRPLPCTKSRSIISSARKLRAATATSFISRDTPLREFIPALISKAASRKRSCRTSAAN